MQLRVGHHHRDSAFLVILQEPRLLEDEAEADVPAVSQSSSSFDRESRQLVGLLAGLGTLETSFLTYEKLFASPEGLSSLCSVGGMSLRCGDVLNSEYANVLGTTAMPRPIISHETAGSQPLIR